MNKTQKNWKKTFEEYEPTEYDRIYRQPRRHLKVRRERPVIFTFVLMAVATIGISYITRVSDHLFVNPKQAVIEDEVETDLESGVEIPTPQIEPNRNGVVMKKSIERLEEIFVTIDKNIETLNRKQLTEYIREVKALDLSAEYDTLKEQSIKKIEKAKECAGAMKNKESEKAIKKINKLIGEYNDMRLYEYMKDAFNQAGIEYTLREDGTIGFYRYYK